MDNLERSLADIRMAPYIVKAMALIGFSRLAGGNMFRHQIATMGILIDYKIIDPVLLKAALIHDLFEDASGLPGVTKKEITGIDADGPAVYDLVMEVTRRTDADTGDKEEKSEFLLRIMKTGSSKAKLLKLADRISNITALGYVHKQPFVRSYIEETRSFVLPYAEQVNADMYRELSDLLDSRERLLPAVNMTAQTTLESDLKCAPPIEA
ncbi:MAG TPA: HD domain-containing protein [Vicinamibacterales bacterium]|nr:HD domain-containing protein [Vicinamibacterales bacterium]